MDLWVIMVLAYVIQDSRLVDRNSKVALRYINLHEFIILIIYDYYSVDFAMSGVRFLVFELFGYSLYILVLVLSDVCETVIRCVGLYSCVIRLLIANKWRHLWDSPLYVLVSFL